METNRGNLGKAGHRHILLSTVQGRKKGAKVHLEIEALGPGDVAARGLC